VNGLSFFGADQTGANRLDAAAIQPEHNPVERGINIEAKCAIRTYDRTMTWRYRSIFRFVEETGIAIQGQSNKEMSSSGMAGATTTSAPYWSRLSEMTPIGR
jgi:hypothetical protein